MRRLGQLYILALSLCLTVPLSLCRMVTHLQISHIQKKRPSKESRFSWATWIRTKNDRTRICSVTITP